MRIELAGLSRSFPGVRAVDAVDLDYEPGRLYALVGENGAGKTTLMRLLYGMLRPDAGEIRVDGEPVQFASSRDAIARGIGMVHQHFMLVDTLSVAENLVLGVEPRRGPLLDLAAARAALRDIAGRLELELDPDAPVGELSVGEAQRVEILKVLHRGASFLIFDEPTAVLSPQETRQLFGVLRRLVDEGRTVVLITHKLDEVLAAAEVVDVMRKGRHVGRLPRAEADAERLAGLMVGREVLLRVERREATPGPPRLEAEGLSLAPRAGRRALHGIDLSIRAGEILGIAGVEGNGQRELTGLLTGLLRPDAGSLRLDGRELADLTPRRARQLGIRHIPEDRQRTGLVPAMSLAENLVLGEEGGAAAGRWGLMNPATVRATAAARLGAFGLGDADPDQPAASLSGGNQQKLLLARELAGEPRLLVASQPTRGVDVGAIESIHRLLLSLRERGLAICLVSAELQELLALSDRIGVLYGGRLVKVFAAAATDAEELGLWMTGARGGAA